MIELVHEPQSGPSRPGPSYTHLRRLTDAGGLYEHAEGTTPRREHGYCVDDVARALVVVCREPAAPELDDLREQYLAFVLGAQEPDGLFHNRREPDRRWSDRPRSRTAGAARCGGSAPPSAGRPGPARAGAGGVRRGVALRSPHRRAMAFAALGAAEVLAVLPGHSRRGSC